MKASGQPNAPAALSSEKVLATKRTRDSVGGFEEKIVLLPLQHQQCSLIYYLVAVYYKA
jgi:hypothetical protein